MAIISNLIARLRADTASFDRKMNKSRQHTTRFGKDIQRMGRQMLALAGVGGGLYAVKRGLGYITRAAMEQEKAEKLLTAATKTNITQYKNYAAEMQKLTIYGDEQILSQMAYAKNLGVTNDKLEAAAKAAIGLAAKFRLDLATSMMLVGRASQGQTQMLTRYGIVLSESLSPQAKFNALLKIGADSFRLAEEEAQDSTGAFTQFKNAAGDLAEVIGKPFLDTMAKDARRAKTNIEILTEAIKKHRESVEETIKTQGRMKYMPIGAPFAAPIVPKDFYRKPESPTALLKPKADPWADMIKGLDETNLATAESVKQIRDKYIPVIQREIDITGRIGEAHYHAAKMIEFENAIKAAGLQDTRESIRLMKEMKNKLKDLEGAQRLAKIADTIGESFASNFERAIFEAKKARDVINSILRDIAMAIVRYRITQPLGLQISGLIGGMFGGAPPGIPTTATRPSTVGPNFVPSAQHGGEVMKTGLAVIHRGERYSGEGGRMQPPSVIINNNTGIPMQQEGPPRLDGKSWVVNVVTEAVDTNISFRRKMGIKS